MEGILSNLILHCFFLIDIILSFIFSLQFLFFNFKFSKILWFDFGRFAAALIDQAFDCWVLNVVPVSGPNTLPVIFDRGLIGVMHDWYYSELLF